MIHRRGSFLDGISLPRRGFGLGAAGDQGNAGQRRREMNGAGGTANCSASNVSRIQVFALVEGAFYGDEC